MNEIHNLFITDITSDPVKETPKQLTPKQAALNPEEFETPVEKQNDIPLSFMLFDRQGNNVKMFSRTCKIKKSRELYEYFENNDSIRMKIN